MIPKPNQTNLGWLLPILLLHHQKLSDQIDEGA